MYLNKALIIGNLTRDPEKKSLPSGIAVTSFSVATNRTYKDKNGAKQDATEYHNIVVFGRQAETAGQYLKKGQSVLVEGRLQTRSWEKDGAKQYRTEILAERVQFGPKGGVGSTGATGSSETPSTGGSKSKAAPAAASDEQIEYPEDEINPEDIPF